MATRRPALEEAAAGSAAPNRVNDFVASVLAVGIDGRGRFESATAIAQRALTQADGSHPRAIKLVMDWHVKLAATGGFLTSLGGFITLPVALPINVLEFYIVATRMTAATAIIRGYDIHEPHVRTAVLLSLVGADASDVLAKAGLKTTHGTVTKLATKGLPGPALMLVNKAIAFQLLTNVGRRSLVRAGRAVPVVGGAVGAAMDGYLIYRIAAEAREQFPEAAAVVVAPERGE